MRGGPSPCSARPRTGSGKNTSIQAKTAVFEALKGFVDPLTTKSLPSYEEVARQLNVSVPAVKTLIHRLRQRNTAIVREEILRTISDPADVEAESHELCQALIEAEGQIPP